MPVTGVVFRGGGSWTGPPVYHRKVIVRLSATREDCDGPNVSLRASKGLPFAKIHRLRGPAEGFWISATKLERGYLTTSVQLTSGLAGVSTLVVVGAWLLLR